MKGLHEGGIRSVYIKGLHVGLQLGLLVDLN